MKTLPRFIAAVVLTGTLAAITAAQSSVCTPDTLAPADGCNGIAYDRFEDKTTVSADMRVLGDEKGERLFLTASGYYIGAIKAPAYVTIALTAYAPEGFPFSGDCTLNVIAGAHRFQIETSKVAENQVAAYSYAQGFGGRLPFADFKTLTQAAAVEMRFCGAEFSLTPAQLARLRTLVGRLEIGGK